MDNYEKDGQDDIVIDNKSKFIGNLMNEKTRELN